MAPNTERKEYESALRRLEKVVDAGEVAPADADAIRTLCSAYDPEDATATLPRDLYDDSSQRDGHKKYSTLAAWTNRLTRAAKAVELTTTDADEINEWTTGLVKDADGPGRARVRSIEYGLTKFYRFHEDVGVYPRDIVVHEYDSADGDWDARDLLDADERLALRSVADNPRDLAVYHLLVYCGLRNTALRKLRVRDIELKNHEWFFNTSADGLKNIHRPNEPRPLFQAEKAVRDWLDYHPTGEPDHYLITARPKWARVDPTEPVSRETIRRVMADLKEKTAERDDVVTVAKPCNPHFLRHNFVSMCRKHPDITDADIKFYLGHAAGSNVMETTYSHLSSDDHNQAGHGAFGTDAAGDGTDDIDPWDTTCSYCDRVLAPGETACGDCGTPRGSMPWDDPAIAEAREQDMEAMAGMVEQVLADRFGMDPDDLADALADG